MKVTKANVKDSARRISPLRVALGVALGLASLAAALYVPFSQWWNDKLHAEAVDGLSASVSDNKEFYDQIRADAQAYNQNLVSSGDHSEYLSQLDPLGTGLMGRILIPKIDVDLPIYHTSSDAVLRKGAGHMPETTLPVGGPNTHAAITAHRGLAEAKLFTDLDKVQVGDTFTLEVLGEPLVYRVENKRIVEPTETKWLVVEPGRDLVTLITCDPLGINTDRMLVTGSRVFPTPQSALDNFGQPSQLPHFPYWVLWAVGGLSAIAWLAWKASQPKKVKTAKSSKTEQQENLVRSADAANRADLSELNEEVVAQDFE